MSSSPIKRFMLQILVWMPAAFFAWYYMGPTIMLPISFLTDLILANLFPGAISSVDATGYYLDIVTTFGPPNTSNIDAPLGKVGDYVISINGLLYGYGLPLFTALVISSPGTEKTKWIRWAIGVGVLILTQVWGIGFDVLKILAFQSGETVRDQMGFSPAQMEGIALGYQFGYLILPAVTPLVLWIGFHREFIITLAPGIAQRFNR